LDSEKKITYLIEECGHKLKNIAALTLTNKGAPEMQKCIAKLLKKSRQVNHLAVKPVHSLDVESRKLSVLKNVRLNTRAFLS
jgi:superfamily I DNA/RNA helicase